MSGHSRADPASYRPEGELEEWLKKDPIPMYRQRLLDFGVKESVVVGIEGSVIEAVDAATEIAKASPTPPRGGVGEALAISVAASTASITEPSIPTTTLSFTPKSSNR